MGIELAIFAAMAGTSVAEGIEQQRAGKAAKKEADKAATQERATAASEAAIASEEAHDILVEGNYEKGSLMAMAGAGGISTKTGGAGLGSLGTLGARIQGDVRRKMFLLQQRTSLTGVQRYQTADTYKRKGRQEYKKGMRLSYMSFAKAGMNAFTGYSSLGSPSTGGAGSGYRTGVGNSGRPMIRPGGKSAGGGNPYFL